MVSRSFDWILENTKQSLALKLPDISKLPLEKELYKLKTEQDLEEFIIGTDSDIGGESNAHWALTTQSTGEQGDLIQDYFMETFPLMFLNLPK